MGKITVNGTASKAFSADLFLITITVRTAGTASGEAITKGKRQTEQLLQLMHEQLGLAPTDLALGEESTGQTYGPEPGYLFTRSLSVRIAADLALAEKLTTLLGTMSDTEYRIDADLNNLPAKERIVIGQAIRNSRQKAEQIAAALGQHITGAEAADTDSAAGEEDALRCAKTFTADADTLTSLLQNPMKTVTASVNIVWSIE